MSTVLQPALVVAVDGPSGSGKSSTSRAVAKRLGCAYLDSGSMYRALAVWCADHDIAASDEQTVASTAATLPISIDTDPARFRILLDGTDVTRRLHTTEVSGMVSGYARVRPARDALNKLMRRLVTEHGRIVIEGRDITTVVAPDADVRVLLQADPQQRINRRELQLKGAADHQTVTEQVIGRDAADSASSQFETPATGVTLIDTTHLNLAQVIDRVVELVPEALASPQQA